MSIFTRIVCGLLGIAGLVAPAVDSHPGTGLSPGIDLLLNLAFGAGFLAIAVFGAPKWATSIAHEDRRRPMTRSKWGFFWVITLSFLAVATVFLVREGVFVNADFVVLGMLGVAFALVGAAIYPFVKASRGGFH